MLLISIICTILMASAIGQSSAVTFKGQYCDGEGDVQFLGLIDRSFEFFHPNPDVQNISMLYRTDWDSLIEGPKWGSWWIQNSYGPTYCSLPFLQEPWLTALQHSQDFWFKVQGDDKTADTFGLVAPDGCLVDCASPDGSAHRQGDGNWKIHDWGLEFTAAGVVMQSELLLISRDAEAIRHYLPHLERACNFLETCRDPANGLFLAGPAANLLAPSYGGVRLPDGTFGKAYLSGLSVTYLAAMDRMVELQKLVGRKGKAVLYEQRRKLTRDSLQRLMTPEGYFVKSVEPNGIRHGVVGQEHYGYFESVVNVDAIALRAVDDLIAGKIYRQIAALPGLRPHGYLITNWPGLDDTYRAWGKTEIDDIWAFGTWVNGGAWSTQEARTIMAYYRLGKFEDIRRSVLHSMSFADLFQLDAPLTEFGKSPWFKDELINVTYDALGIPAATIRGLFEYVYSADSLTLYPHVPSGIRQYTQKVPIRWGDKRIMISIENGGPRVKSARINGKNLRVDAPDRIVLSYDALPDNASLRIITEGGWPEPAESPAIEAPTTPRSVKLVDFPESMAKPFAELKAAEKNPGDAYARAYLAETIRAFEAWRERASRDAAGGYPQFSPEKRQAILKQYQDAALNLHKGFMAYCSGAGRPGTIR